jgi:threonine dehydrogenase-like Zn-dependent dehydrogenase
VFLDQNSPEPSAGPGEVVIRPTLVGLGASDLAVARGEIPFEGVMGHQFVGVVQGLGEGVDARWRGARVVGNINIADASSELARRGLGNHAPDRRVLGLVGKDGCLAERFTLPASNLARVPEGVSDDAAVFAEPLAGAVHASRIVHLERKGFVTVIGDNLSALLCAQVMEPLNNTVRLLGRRPERYELAERWGVRHRHLSEVGLRGDQDVVIVCTGSAEDFALAVGMVRPRGKIVLRTEPIPLPGAKGEGAGVDLMPVIRDEIEIYGARCGSAADAVGVLASGRIDVTSLITKRAKLADAVSALRAAGEPAQIKVLIEV